MSSHWNKKKVKCYNKLSGITVTDTTLLVIINQKVLKTSSEIKVLELKSLFTHRKLSWKKHEKIWFNVDRATVAELSNRKRTKK